MQTIGNVERLDPAIDALIPLEAVIEILAEGFEWSEGPVWIADGGFLLFSDVPQDTIFKWEEGEGCSPWLSPSGYTGDEPRAGEPGSNGLLLDDQGRLVLCQHGDRRVARLDAPFDRPRPTFTTLADRSIATTASAFRARTTQPSTALATSTLPTRRTGCPRVREIRQRNSRSTASTGSRSVVRSRSLPKN
jgi:hypothetical protein